MADFDKNSYSEAELEAEFDRLFPQGFAGPDVLQELAPDGWENSPLLAVFHPSVEQIYEESLRLHRNLGKLRRPDDQRPVAARTDAGRGRQGLSGASHRGRAGSPRAGRPVPLGCLLRQP